MAEVFSIELKGILQVQYKLGSIHSRLKLDDNITDNTILAIKQLSYAIFLHECAEYADKVEVIIYSTFYKELSNNIVKFCDKKKNQPVEICFIVYIALLCTQSWK